MMLHDLQRIRRYLDGELSSAEAHVFRTHLAECSVCRRQLGALELLDARLSELERIVPAFDFATQVRAKIAYLPPPYPQARWQMPTAIGLALVGLLAIAATFESFLASASDLYTLLLQTQNWAVNLLNGRNGFGSLDLSYSGGAPLTLVIGLALICMSSVLLLRRSLAEPLDAW